MRSSCSWRRCFCRRRGASRAEPEERAARVRRARGGSYLEPAYRIAEVLGLPPFKLWFNWRFEGLDQIPERGPVLLAANHISYLDPVAHAYFLAERGRRARFLAKSELFEIPVFGAALRNAKQIPVQR